VKIQKIQKRNNILIASFPILSTGVNIKRLHNMIFSSPMKSFTTITQSIGRGMRLHNDKDEFNVYDLVDNFGVYKPSGIFFKQYTHRKSTSYNPEEFPIIEREFNLF
jgi:type I site-specific restriction endonuclease